MCNSSDHFKEKSGLTTSTELCNISFFVSPCDQGTPVISTRWMSRSQFSFSQLATMPGTSRCVWHSMGYSATGYVEFAHATDSVAPSLYAFVSLSASHDPSPSEQDLPHPCGESICPTIRLKLFQSISIYIAFSSIYPILIIFDP